jgi:hypothetical protein
MALRQNDTERVAGLAFLAFTLMQVRAEGRGEGGEGERLPAEGVCALLPWTVAPLLPSDLLAAAQMWKQS